MCRFVEINYKNYSMRIFEKLMFFDVWLLIKTKRFINKLIYFLIPILKVILFMSLGAVVLLAYVFAYGRFDVNLKTGFHCVNFEPTVNKYLEIDDDSESNTIALKKELIRIKSESMNLGKTLHRMNIYLKNLHNRQKNLDVNLADFASEAVGGLIIDTPDTQSYFKPVSNQMTFFGIPIWKTNYYTPRKVIQPWTEPGECWAFQGSYGKIEILLAYPASVERVTLEHIPASASLTGNINDAPKNFNVYGKVGNEHILIGSFMYNNEGLFSQTFEIKPNLKTAFARVILEILTNWGNSAYTCIYRFKVHGKVYDVIKHEI